MTATVPRFLALLGTNGSDVTFHREEGSVPCPCRTPEGFRDPAWHLERPEFANAVHVADPAAAHYGQMGVIVEPGGAFVAGTYRVELLFADDLMTRWVYPEAGFTEFTVADNDRIRVDFWMPAVTDPLATHVHIVIRNMATPAVFHDVFTAAVANVPKDTNQEVLVNTPPPNNNNYSHELCNEQGMLPETITNLACKAFVQPATLGQRGRAAERMLEVFGELRQDDHFGVFPCVWNGTVLDFTDWSSAGEDFIIYDGRRFVVVAADKVPDVDGDPDHHWEVGLRIVDPERVL